MYISDIKREGDMKEIPRSNERKAEHTFEVELIC